MWIKGRERLVPLTVRLGMNNRANAHISIQLGLGGISTRHTVACDSSAMAIGETFRRMRNGEATSSALALRTLQFICLWRQ